MDLIQDYGSSCSSSSCSSRSEDEQGQKEQRHDDGSSLRNTDSESSHCRRKRDCNSIIWDDDDGLSCHQQQSKRLPSKSLLSCATEPDRNNFHDSQVIRPKKAVTWNFPTKLVSFDDSSVYLKRNQPHITGNWLGHIYLNLDDDEDDDGDDNEDGDEHDHSFYPQSDDISLLKEMALKTIMDFQRKMSGEIMVPTSSSTIDVAPSIQNDKIASNHCHPEEELVLVSHVPLLNILASNTTHDTIMDACARTRARTQPKEYRLNTCSDWDASCIKDNTMDCRQKGKLHISLSRPFYLQKHSIDPFMADLKKRVHGNILHPLMVAIPFCNTNEDEPNMTAVDTEILTNDDKTRSFLTLPVHLLGGEGGDGMQSIVKIVDCVMEKYGQKAYYQNPKFHVSIASWNYSQGVIEKWQHYQQSFANRKIGGIEKDLKKHKNMLTFVVHGIHCDFGKVKRYWIPFGDDPS